MAGNVDFIWGSSRAALFEESEIRTVGDTTSATSGGYVLQARVPNAADKGFVFLNSSLTHGPGPGPLHGDVPDGATWLARSPGGTATWDNVAFINCRWIATWPRPAGPGLGVNGQPAPNPVVPNAVSGWREYGTLTCRAIRSTWPARGRLSAAQQRRRGRFRDPGQGVRGLRQWRGLEPATVKAGADGREEALRRLFFSSGAVVLGRQFEARLADADGRAARTDVAIDTHEGKRRHADAQGRIAQQLARYPVTQFRHAAMVLAPLTWKAPRVPSSTERCPSADGMVR